MSVRQRLRTKQGVTLLGVLCLALGLIVTNASASFQGTATTSITITSATMTITVGTNNVTTGASNIVPGDVIDREIDLTPAGTASVFASWTVTTTGSGNALDTQCSASCTGKGLQLTIDNCSQAWTGTVGSQALTCGGTSNNGSGTSALTVRDIVQTSAALNSGSTYQTIGTTNYLRIRITFPGGSSNDDSNFQNLSDTINFTFHGVQRANVQK